MTIATLKFNLSDPDDKRDHSLAMKAVDMSLALWAVGVRIRDTEKYDKPHLTQDEYYEILNSYNLNLLE